MTNLTMADILKNIRDLPALPVVVVELLTNLGQDDANTQVLAEKVSRDQALTAKTLRLANSSFYGMQNKVTTIQQAIAILGYNSVRTLVTAAAVIGHFSPDAAAHFDYQIFWRHSIATALCAKALARQLRVDRDHAFMVGLLHDIGRLVLVTGSPQHYGEVLSHQAALDCELIDAEHAVLGIDHAMVGHALAEHWKFPLVVQQAIALHHTPDRHAQNPLIAIVHLANCIAHALDFSGDATDMVPPVSPSIWTDLKLEKSHILQIFSEAESQVEDVCQILL